MNTVVIGILHEPYQPVRKHTSLINKSPTNCMMAPLLIIVNNIRGLLYNGKVELYEPQIYFSQKMHLLMSLHKQLSKILF